MSKFDVEICRRPNSGGAQGGGAAGSTQGQRLEGCTLQVEADSADAATSKVSQLGLLGGDYTTGNVIES